MAEISTMASSLGSEPAHVKSALQSEQSAEESAIEQELASSAIRVVVRVRPLLPLESTKGGKQTILSADVDASQVHVDLRGAKDQVKRKSFAFDAVLDKGHQQNEVFKRAGLDHLIKSVLDGYDGTVFAYGQTGSGKTYTMEGFEYAENSRLTHVSGPESTSNIEVQINQTEPARLGIVPRVTEALFERMQTREREDNLQFRVRCSYIQIYNEKILDLLNPEHLVIREGRLRTRKGSVNPNELAGLRMRFSSATGQFYVEDLFEVECSSAGEVMEQFQTGVRAKIMGSHKLNAASSRSHCMFTLRVDTVDVTRPDETKYSARLALIDLAGSERVAVTGATGKTLKEAGCINKSLFALRNVITAISKMQQQYGSDSIGDMSLQHIPFRDSKLTSLLQHSLGGTSLTVMIACVSPSDIHAEENLSTLAYAARAKEIRNRPRRNEDAKSRLIRKLKREVQLLRKQLQQAQEVSGIHLGKNASAASRNLANSTSRDGDDARSREVQNLKQELLGSITIMKRMHEIEKELRERMEEAEEDVQSLQVDNSKLHDENQRLREHEQVLLHLLERSGEHEVHSVLADRQTPSQSALDDSVRKQMIYLEKENEQLKEALEHAQATSFAHEYAAAAPPALGSPAAKRSASKHSLSSNSSESRVLKRQGSSTSSKKLLLATAPAHQRSSRQHIDVMSSPFTGTSAQSPSLKPRKPQVMSVDELRALLSGSGASETNTVTTPGQSSLNIGNNFSTSTSTTNNNVSNNSQHAAKPTRIRPETISVASPRARRSILHESKTHSRSKTKLCKNEESIIKFYEEEGDLRQEKMQQVEIPKFPVMPSATVAPSTTNPPKNSNNPFEKMAMFSSLLHRKR